MKGDSIITIMQRILIFFLLASYLILGSLAYTTYFANAETIQNMAHIASESEPYLDQRSTYVVQKGDTLLSAALEMGVDLQEMYCLLPPSFQQDQPLVIGERLSPPLPNSACHRTRDGETISSIAENYNVPLSLLIDIGWNQSVYPALMEMADGSPLPAGIFLRIPVEPKQQETQPVDEEFEQDSVALKRLLQKPVDTQPLGPAQSAEDMADNGATQQPDIKPLVSMVVGIQSKNEQRDDITSGGRASTEDSVEPAAIRNDTYPTFPLRLENGKLEIVGPTPLEWPYGSGEFIWPLQGWLTQDYHTHHRAVDIAAPIGTPIVAVDRGRVTRAGWNEQGYGLFVIIDHNIGYVTLYAHLSEIWVKAGDIVTQGQFLGAVGSTGNSTGPHLHLEIRDFGKRVDPLDFLVQ